LKNIEEQRAKLLRRQEKLKQNVLKDAQAFRQRKAEQAAKLEHVVQINNVKGAEGRSLTSPTRVAASEKQSSLTSPVANSSQAVILGGEEDKNADEKAEEKKKMDMMRKFYRNRHSSFLQALAEQKAKKELEEKAVKDKAEKKKLKATQKVLGDGSRIKSKLFDS